MSRAIDVNCLIPDAENRKYGGTELISSIISGEEIYTPLLVEKGEKTGQYLVIDGHRRLASAKEAGIEKVPCEILDKEAADRARAITNIDRQALSPLDQYTAIVKLRELGFETSTIGDMLGISKYQVERRLRLNNLIEPIKEKLLSGELTVEKASEFALASHDIQQRLYDNSGWLLSSMYTPKDVRESINNANGISLLAYPDELLDIVGLYESPCLQCKYNPSSDYLLFEEPTKADSYCTLGNYSCIAMKLGSLYLKHHDVDGICSKNKEVIEFAKSNGIKILEREYPRYSKLEDDFAEYTTVIDDDGCIYYQNVVRQLESEDTGNIIEDRIDTLIEECEKHIRDIFKILTSAYKDIPVPLLSHEVKLVLLSAKHRANYCCIWDSSIGSNWEDALKKTGLRDVLDGKVGEPLLGMEHKGIDELIRFIMFENDVYLLLHNQGIGSIAGFVPTAFSVKYGTMGENLYSKLDRILELARTWWKLNAEVWDNVYRIAGQYKKPLEELKSISDSLRSE